MNPVQKADERDSTRGAHAPVFEEIPPCLILGRLVVVTSDTLK
jgi:hypothetical protein